MNAVWVDENADADYARCRAHGVRRLYFSSRQATAVMLADAQNQRFQTGIYWASSWDVGLPAPQQAKKLSDAWTALRVSAYVMVDIEEHDPSRVVEFFTNWRTLRPKIATAWTLEGFQGGWVAGIRDSLVPFQLRYLPQCYDGNMAPFDVAGTLKDLTDYGFPADRVEPMHDAALLSRGWFGCAFTQARLPA